MPELPLVFAVIDDDAAVRTLLCALIRTMGDTAIEAGSYSQAQLVLREYPWDIALIDRRLPEGDGVELRARPPCTDG